MIRGTVGSVAMNNYTTTGNLKQEQLENSSAGYILHVTQRKISIENIQILFKFREGEVCL